MTITVDTNVLPLADIEDLCRQLNWSIMRVSVTERETAGTDLAQGASHLETIPETGVWDESTWGHCVWADDKQGDHLDRILEIISSGSFCRDRQSLNKGQRRQLRDAMILEAHIRGRNDIFVTNDTKGFVKNGKRDLLQSEFAIRIMTRDEFVGYARSEIEKQKQRCRL